jgi:hypothetical protein
MIYIAVVAAIAVIPSRLGGYGAVFQAADAAFRAKGSGGILLAPDQYLPYATLALGSALAAFMYPHTLTGVFASASANTIRKNAILLPAYTLLLGLLALLGYMGHAAGLTLSSNNDVVPALFKALFPGWFAGFAFAAIAIGALVPAAVMSIGAANLFTRNFWKAYVNPEISVEGEAQVAKVTSLVVKIGALHPLSADTICTRSAAVRRLVDPPNVSCGGVRTIRRMVHGSRAPTGLAGRIPGRHVAGLVRRVEAAAYGRVRQHRVLFVCRVAGARDQHCRRSRGQCRPDAEQAPSFDEADV